MNQEIKITFDRSAFESMYFRDYEDSYFLGKKMKPRFIAVLSITILSPLITISLHDSWPLLMMGSWVLFWIVWIDYLMMISKVYKWKKEILKSLDALSKVSSMKIQLNEEGITLFQDDHRIDEKWEGFEEFEISASYILLKGETDYFFPLSSMHPNDFSIFNAIVRTKIKNEEIDLLDEI